MEQKRYEFWAFEDGKPVKKFTRWFPCEHNQGDIQYKGRITLRNEYR